MQAFEIAELMQQRGETNNRYLEFLRVPALSVGVYTLAANATDGQLPHTEDEVYYVVRGQAHIRVDDKDRAVQAGSIVFVAANIPHIFHSITEELTVVVFFAPAEYSRAATPPNG